jgi:NADPH-dependent 2,4-dienoyl-CoA reductase/sulfur reductase-like enzyme
VKSIAVIGGSLAGLSAARALRNQGFDGRLTVVSDEQRRPYDRPPLSKSFLAGTATEADLSLEAEHENLDADWQFGLTATALHASTRSIELCDGTSFTADGIVIATGARPRPLAPGPPRGVHVLRTLDDSLALRKDLQPGARLVVVGAGFIGAEVASTARGLGLDVTVIEAAPTPLSAPLGTQMGMIVSALHADHGVRLLCGVGVVGLTGAERVEGVVLADGRTLTADVVLVGVGVQPNTEWLASSGLDASNGVRCNAYGVTDIPNVVAVGDCASWYDPLLGEHHRLEHWTGARERAAIAVSSLLSGGTDNRAGRAPYFWSDQYGLTIQMVGHTRSADSVRVEEGSTDERDFLAVYRRAEEPVAILALGHGKSFMRWRRQLGSQPAPLSPSVSAL